MQHKTAKRIVLKELEQQDINLQSFFARRLIEQIDNCYDIMTTKELKRFIADWFDLYGLEALYAANE